MDALDRILPLAGLLWPTLDCDVSIRRDPERVTSAGAVYLARVFDLDHPDGSAALPLADASGATPTEATEALAVLLAERARPQLDAILRAAGYPAPDASTRADLAADVARLERVVADLTRQRDGALGVALLDGHVSPSERADLRPELAALATMIRRTLRAWDAADAGAEVLPLKRTGSAR